MNKDDEIIGHLPRHTLEELNPLGHGITPDPESSLLHHMIQNIQWGRRGPLEIDPSHKQIIPYLVLQSSQQHLWTMGRTQAQSEARLHHKRSLGVGGHLNQVDDDHPKHHPILAGMYRELFEEIEIHPSQIKSLSYIGTLNDDSNPVGQVHLGVVYVAHLDNDAIDIRERDKMTGAWLTVDELHQSKDTLETWSSLLLEHLFPTP